MPTETSSSDPNFVNIDDQLSFQLPNGSREIQIAYGDGSKILCVYQQLLAADHVH